MTTYDVYLRDRKDPITVEADHMDVERDKNGVPVGFDFVKQNPAHTNVSIAPVRVLYAPADRVVAIAPRETAATPPPGRGGASDSGIDAVLSQGIDALSRALRDSKRR